MFLGLLNSKGLEGSLQVEHKLSYRESEGALSQLFSLQSRIDLGNLVSRKVHEGFAKAAG